MDGCLLAFQSGRSEQIAAKLNEFNVENAKLFNISGPLVKKKQLVDGIFRFLRDPQYMKDHALLLSTLRIISRDKMSLDELFLPDRIETLLHLARLVGEEEAYMTDSSDDFDSVIVVEAQKCLCNLIFNSPVIQRMCCHSSCIDGIMLRLRIQSDPKLPNTVKYFDMRMLFLLTAFCADVRPRIRNDYHGFIYLTEAIDLIIKGHCDEAEKRQVRKSLRRSRGSRKGKGEQKDKNCKEDSGYYCLDDADVDLACEVLKVLFNLTCCVDRSNVDEAEEAHFIRLVGILHDLLLVDTKDKEKREELHSNTVNLLTNIPTTCYDELLIPIEEIGKLDDPYIEFEDTNVEAIAVLMEFLEKRMDTPSKTMTPVLMCLIEMSKSNNIIRKYLRTQILPPLKDVMNRPEDGITLRNRLVKLMTNPNTDVKELVANFLFVLCKESVGRLIKYTGYGNAAGLLANRGFMGGSGKNNYSSDSDDSDTEEYLQYKDKINPVIGCYEEPKPNPLDSMSDEQKEYEAMQLVSMMEKLTQAGTIKPCTVGSDGKPHPIEHVNQLQNRTQSNSHVMDDESD